MRRREFLVLGPALFAAGLLPGRARAAGGPPLEYIAHVKRPQNLASPLAAFDRLLTPNDIFFVRSHFGPPALDPRRRVRVTGLVKRPLELSVKELARLEQVEVTAVLQCAGNSRSFHRPRVPGVQWGHGAMGQAVWRGPRLAAVLERAGIKPGAKHVVLRGADRPPQPTVPAFVRSLPLEKATEPTTLLALQMNGEPLDLAHGAPVRLCVPGWAGDHWMKWVEEIRVDDKEAPGFYMQTAYKLPKSPVAPGAAVPPADLVSLTVMPVRSVIARPAEGTRAPVGPQEVVGVAFSGQAAIARVEVSLDGGQSWRTAALEGEPGPGRWQVFRHRFEVRTPGPLEAVVRATDASGATQPPTAVWNPGGYFWNGWHRVQWSAV